MGLGPAAVVDERVSGFENQSAVTGRGGGRGEGIAVGLDVLLFCLLGDCDARSGRAGEGEYKEQAGKVHGGYSQY
jgi:hypothetical protein